jgi:predicted GH43/DUF377 family glycosyl hydrolase
VVRRLWEKLLLRPGDLEPSRDDFEIIGVFNPAAVRADGEVVLLVRVAERPREHRANFTALPRWSADRGWSIDWARNDELDLLDPRVVRGKSDGMVRLTFVSHLRVVRCGDGRAVRSIEAERVMPEREEEEYGVEDPRLTYIEGQFWFTYVAVSRHGAATALASTRDFKMFQRHGLIFCPENKDVVLFPERIGGKYCALHRPNGATRFTRPEIWLARSQDLIHWGHHEPVCGGIHEWESGRIGAGAPPLKTAEGWLAIYHGNRRPRHEGDVGSYCGAALLLDLKNPSQVLRRSQAPVLEPTADFECQGFVPQVVFPTGVVATPETLLVYCGAADTFTTVVELPRDDLLA